VTDVDLRAQQIVADVHRRWSVEPAGVWVAPGRVNLIGEHTDYNDGLVLPLAIDREAVVAAAPRADGIVRAWSRQRDDEVTIAMDDVAQGEHLGWIGYVAGVVWMLRTSGFGVGGLDLAIDCDVPAGAGLSSSAALECAVALATADLAGATLDRLSLALAAQRAEREVVGAPVGLMDQAIAMLAAPDTALFLDCRSLRHEQVPLRLAEAGLTVLVIDTRSRHSHATGGYAARRAECAAAAAALDVASLRDAEPSAYERLSGALQRRARHVLTENERVRAAVELLQAGRIEAVGPLLTASHASLRDDFQVSTPELDVAAEAAVIGGAFGARMTGGGFGGCVLALAPTAAVPAVREAVTDAFARRDFTAPEIFSVEAVGGARRLPDF
jgi:galactokinase